MRIKKKYMFPAACIALTCVAAVLVLFEGKSEEALVIAMMALCLGGNLCIKIAYDDLLSYADKLEHLCNASISHNMKLIGDIKSRNKRIDELEAKLAKKEAADEAR